MDKNEWEVADDECQQFYGHWHDLHNFDFPTQFPYRLSLGGVSPIRPHDTKENVILITKSYNDIFHRILRLRHVFLGNTRGVVLNGQPGTGTFL